MPTHVCLRRTLFAATELAAAEVFRYGSLCTLRHKVVYSGLPEFRCVKINKLLALFFCACALPFPIPRKIMHTHTWPLWEGGASGLPHRSASNGVASGAWQLQSARKREWAPKSLVREHAHFPTGFSIYHVHVGLPLGDTGASSEFA